MREQAGRQALRRDRPAAHEGIAHIDGATGATEHDAQFLGPFGAIAVHQADRTLATASRESVITYSRVRGIFSPGKVRGLAKLAGELVRVVTETVAPPIRWTPVVAAELAGWPCRPLRNPSGR